MGCCVQLLGNGLNRWMVVQLSVEGKGLPKGISPGFSVGDTVDWYQIKSGEREIKRQLSVQGLWCNKIILDTVTDSVGIKIKYRADIVRLMIGGWIVEKGDGLDSLVTASVLPRRGSPLTPVVLTRGVVNLTNAVKRLGFPFADVDFIGIKESGGSVYPVLKVNEGERVLIKFVTFAGNYRTADKLLLRYSGFNKPRVYSPELINLWSRNLENTHWIKVDSEEIVKRPDGVYGVRYWISELGGGNVYGIVGYIVEERRLNGWAGVNLVNIMHTGRKLGLEWRSLTGSTYYMINYTEPWFLTLPVSLSGTIDHNVIDTSYSLTCFQILGMFSLGYSGFSLASGVERLAGKKRSSTLWVGTGFVFDNRDRLVNPRSGVFLKTRTSAGERRNGESVTAPIFRLEVDLEPILTIKGNWSWVNHFTTKTLWCSKELTIAEMYRIGGIASVRGYNDGVFVSGKAGWWNCELRYSFNNSTRVGTFFDAGIYQTSDKSYARIYGYGIGGRWETRLGILGMDYGVAVGENPLHGKIHLIFEGGFK